MRQRKIKQEKRTVQTKRRRLLVMGGVLVLAVVAALGIIALNQPPQPVGEFTAVQPKTWPLQSGRALGPQEAKVNLLLFSDFQCPYCGQFHETILSQLVSQYIEPGRVRLEFRHLIVIDGNTGGSESRRSAEASQCAADQNRFWDFANMVFANQGGEGRGGFSDVRLKAFGASLGLDAASFNACFDAGRYGNQVVQDERQAQALGIRATPALLVNNNPVSRTLEWPAVQAAIDAALKAAGQ